jgi:hypothetical protein
MKQYFDIDFGIIKDLCFYLGIRKVKNFDSGVKKLNINALFYPVAHKYDFV